MNAHGHKITLTNSLQEEVELKIQKGYFMKGTILSACGSSCDCGKKFQSTKNELMGEVTFPQCKTCKAIPKKLRIKKTVPNLDGIGEAIFVYTGLDGKTLTNVLDAAAVITHINEELKTGSFNFLKWGSKKTRNLLLFENFAEVYLESEFEKTKVGYRRKKPITEAWYKKKVGYFKNHLIPFFKGTPLNRINKRLIEDYYFSFKPNSRVKDLSTAELKVMLRYALEEHEPSLITKIPPFPSLKSAKKTKRSEVISLELQAEIIKNISNPKYRAMWTLCASYTIRPQEVRALRVEDFNFGNREMSVNERMSDSFGGDRPLGGRKSINEDDEFSEMIYPMDDFIVDLVGPYLTNKCPRSFVFESELFAGRHVSDDALREAWNSSCKKLGVKVPPYKGTKTATATSNRELFGKELSKAFTGHKTDQAHDRYAIQGKKKAPLQLVRTERFQDEDSYESA